MGKERLSFDKSVVSPFACGLHHILRQVLVFAWNKYGRGIFGNKNGVRFFELLNVNHCVDILKKCPFLLVLNC